MKCAVKGLALLATLFSATVVLANPVKEFSADSVDAKSGRLEGKVYVTSTKMRFEDYASGEKPEFISLIRFDQQKMYFLFTDSKTYIEYPLEVKSPSDWKEMQKVLGGLAEMPGIEMKTTEKKVAEETVNGYKTEKFRITETATFMGTRQTSTSYVWIAKEFSIPIRTQDDEDDGKITELRNIKIGAPPASLFELPAGYKLDKEKMGQIEEMRNAMDAMRQAPTR